MYKLGIIGAGKMAGALLRGILRAKVYSKNEIILSDLDENRLSQLKKEHGVSTTEYNRVLAERSETILFAVKPLDVQPLLRDIKNQVSKNRYVVHRRQEADRKGKIP